VPVFGVESWRVNVILSIEVVCGAGACRDRQHSVAQWRGRCHRSGDGCVLSAVVMPPQTSAHTVNPVGQAARTQSWTES